MPTAISDQRSVRLRTVDGFSALGIPAPPAQFPLPFPAGQLPRLRPRGHVEARAAILNIVQARVFDMPEELAGHPECGSSLDPVRDTVGDGAQLTQINLDCPGVLEERVVQVATNQFVWIQVRSSDRATANRVLMLENAIYAVASPEASASILWKDAARAQDAANNMRITAQDLLGFGVIDGIIPEPPGGAHRHPDTVMNSTANAIATFLKDYPGTRSRLEIREQRREKFMAIGTALN